MLPLYQITEHMHLQRFTELESQLQCRDMNWEPVRLPPMKNACRQLSTEATGTECSGLGRVTLSLGVALSDLRLVTGIGSDCVLTECKSTHGTSTPVSEGESGCGGLILWSSGTHALPASL